MAHLRDPTFFSVFDVGPCHEALFEGFTHKELRALQVRCSSRTSELLFAALRCSRLTLGGPSRVASATASFAT